MKELKNIRELRKPYEFKIDSITSHLRYIRTDGIDYDVYLPTLGINLQRELCWTLQQKQELIMSVLIGRKIPRFSLIIKQDNSYQVIDGKQRLNTLYDFIDNKFTITLEDEIYFYSQLPQDYRVQFDRLQIEYDRMIEYDYAPITDETKIDWFYFINFAGTPQDLEHLKKLKNKL